MLKNLTNACYNQCTATSVHSTINKSIFSRLFIPRFAKLPFLFFCFLFFFPSLSRHNIYTHKFIFLNIRGCNIGIGANCHIASTKNLTWPQIDDVVTQQHSIATQDFYHSHQISLKNINRYFHLYNFNHFLIYSGTKCKFYIMNVKVKEIQILMINVTVL